MNYDRYLGDAVYASFDGYHIVLRTGDGNNQQIALEPSVFHALVEYEADLRRLYEQQRGEPAEEAEPGGMP